MSNKEKLTVREIIAKHCEKNDFIEIVRGNKEVFKLVYLNEASLNGINQDVLDLPYRYYVTRYTHCKLEDNEDVKVKATMIFLEN